MTTAPMFAEIISQTQRQAEASAAAAAAALVVQRQEATRLAAIATEQLANLVLPMLERAQEELRAAGIVAEIGNARDSQGNLRRSLRILTTRREFPPCVVFTAEKQDTTAGLAHHTEMFQRPAPWQPERLADVSEATLRTLVADFLAAAIR